MVLIKERKFGCFWLENNNIVILVLIDDFYLIKMLYKIDLNLKM